jgi:hypothetical protein
MKGNNRKRTQSATPVTSYFIDVNLLFLAVINSWTVSLPHLCDFRRREKTLCTWLRFELGMKATLVDNLRAGG